MSSYVRRTRSIDKPNGFTSEAKQQKLEGDRTDWRSLNIVNITSFLVAVQFSVYLTSVWPYLQAVGITSPLFGFWSNRTKRAGPPILLGISLMILGNVLYIYAEYMPSAQLRKWTVMVARVIDGAGADGETIKIKGAVPVVRSYAATACLPRHKEKSISICIACASIGRAIGPAIQILFVLLGATGYNPFGILPVNMYTGPAIFSIIALLMNGVLLLAYFHEHYSGVVPDETKQDRYFVLRNPDRLAVGICLFIWFVGMMMQTNTESILTPYTMIIYDWQDEQAVRNTGYLIFACNIVSMIVYMVFALTRLRNIDQRLGIGIGISCFLMYYIITYPYSAWKTKIDYQIQDIIPVINNSISTTTSLTTHPTTQPFVAVGCDDSYTWCRTTPVVNEWVLFIAFDIFIGIGWCPLMVPLSVLYSRILGPRLQGTMQGLLAQIGSFGRAVAPPLMSYIFQEWGPRPAWAFQIGLLIMAGLLIIVCRNRLVPLKLTVDKDEKINYSRGIMYRF